MDAQGRKHRPEETRGGKGERGEQTRERPQLRFPVRWELRGNPDAHRLLPFHAHETWIVFPVLAEEESEWRSILPGITRKEWWSRDLSPCLIPKPILSQCVQWVDRARPRGRGAGQTRVTRAQPAEPCAESTLSAPLAL